MAVKVLNFKMDETEILDIKKVASVFNMTVTDIVKEAVREYLEKMKSDPFYRLTINAEEASADESVESLAEIERLSDDDLAIVSVKRFMI